MLTDCTVAKAANTCVSLCTRCRIYSSIFAIAGDESAVTPSAAAVDATAGPCPQYSARGLTAHENAMKSTHGICQHGTVENARY
jgi:hypothetical protein